MSLRINQPDFPAHISLLPAQGSPAQSSLDDCLVSVAIPASHRRRFNCLLLTPTQQQQQRQQPSLKVIRLSDSNFAKRLNVKYFTAVGVVYTKCSLVRKGCSLLSNTTVPPSPLLAIICTTSPKQHLPLDFHGAIRPSRLVAFSK